MQRPALFTAPLVLAGCLLAGCSSGGGSSGSVGAATQSSSTANSWFRLLYDSLRTESFSPVTAARVIGYSGVAAYEAVVPGMPNNRSLSGQLNDLSVPEIDPGAYHWPQVLNRALFTVLSGFFSAASAPTMQAITDLEADLRDEFAMTIAASTLDSSDTRGEEIGMAILDWAATDGYATFNNCAYTIPTGPGLWEPTPPAFANPLQPCWGDLRPFALLFAAECAPLGPPPYSTDPGSPFFQEGLEVRDTVDNLTQEQMDIAHFWADSPGMTGTPPGHWISIVGQVLDQNPDFMLDQAVEAYARVGIAVNDAFIACWEIKYFYNLLRPITYIQDPAAINDPTWTTVPGIGTPPFPEYTSGHSTQSGAAAQVLTDLWGNLAFTDDTHAGTFPARMFTSFHDAAEEAAISRLYAGIHYRAAIEQGIDQGRCIGQTIVDQVEFKE